MGVVARGARGGDEVGPPGSRSTVAYEFGDAVHLDLGGEGGGWPAPGGGVMIPTKLPAPKADTMSDCAGPLGLERCSR